MSLDADKPSTPENEFFKKQKETGSVNTGGRPKGALGRRTHPQVKERLLGKWRTHPVDKLVEIANRLSATNPEKAAEIWTNLLKYFEPTKKPVESVPEKNSPEESVLAAQETFRLLEAIENGTNIDPQSGEGTGMAPGTTPISSETVAKKDLPGHKEQ